MGILGDMIVRIRGDTSSMVQSLQSADKEVKKFAKFFIGGAGIGGVILILRQFGKVIGDAVKLIEEQEKAEAKLTSAIKATGREAVISVQSISRLANSLQMATVYSDEATLSAAAMVQQLANLDENQLKQIIPRIMDFAAAMGVDLETAATLIGKTLGSTTNALGRYGVQVDMSGDKSQKFENLIKALDGKFAGMAVTIGETTTGKLKILQNQFDETKQQLAFELLPVLNEVANALVNMFKGIRVLQTAEEIVSEKGFREAISNLRNAKEAIEILTAAIIEAEKHKSWFGTYSLAEKKRLEQLRDRLTMLRQVIPLLEAQEKAEGKIAKQTEKAAEASVKAAEAADEEKERLIELYGTINQAIINMAENWTMAGVVLGTLEETVDRTNQTLETMTDNWVAMGHAMRTEIPTAVDMVKVAMDNMTNNWVAMGYAFQGTVKRILVEFDVLVTVLGSSIANIINSLSSLWNNYYAGLIEDQQLLLENQNLTEAQQKKIQKEIRRLRHEAAVAQRTYAIVEAVINTAVAITKALTLLPPLNWIQAALVAAEGAAQIAAIAAQKIPALAKGGKLTRPTLVMGGEAGPEWMVPELKLDELGGRIAEAMQKANITNVINNNQPIMLGINIDGKALNATITKNISNRQIIVAREAVA